MRLVHRLGMAFALAVALCAMAAGGHPVAGAGDDVHETATLVAPDALALTTGISETERALDAYELTHRTSSGSSRVRAEPDCHTDAARCSARARDVAARALTPWLALIRSGFLSTFAATPPPSL